MNLIINSPIISVQFMHDYKHSVFRISNMSRGVAVSPMPRVVWIQPREGMRTVDAAGLEIGDDHPPRIMGVLNVSKESPYKPSVFNDPSEAAEYVDRNSSTTARTSSMSASSQRTPNTSPNRSRWRKTDSKRSRRSSTNSTPTSRCRSRRAMRGGRGGARHGFDVVNDICGFADPEMPRVCEEFDAAVAKMASPPDLTRPGAIEEVDDIYEALQRDGFTDKTIIDPAFGGRYDGKDSRTTGRVRRLREFRAVDRPMLTATNREDFLGDLADQPETENQLAVSLAAATMEAERGAHIIRTHDTRETHDVVKVADALGDERTTRPETDSGPTVAELTDVTLREVARHQALGETVAGGTDDGATLTFLLGDVTDDARASLRAVAEVTSSGGRERRRESLRRRLRGCAKVVTDSLAEDGHRELAGELRTSLSRRV